MSTMVSGRAETAPSRQHLAGKYVTFFLENEEYGLPILAVREIIGLVPITSVPQTPPYIRGIINLRGQVIPVVDLRLKFGMPPGEETRESCIIVVRVHDLDTGVIVDRMSEVTDVEEENIEEAPQMGAEVDTSFILGIDKSDDRVRLLLDLEKVLAPGVLKAVHENAAA